jgi:hypothetical protein
MSCLAAYLADSIIKATGVLNNLGNDNTSVAVLGFLKAPRMLRLGRCAAGRIRACCNATGGCQG